jgi:GDP-4-dehydro-6-deoxy-D-mannose reductase
MRILVTGASGFAGQHLVRLLTSENNEVIAWGRSDSEGLGVTIDLLDPAQPGKQDLTGLDYVVHLAGLAAAGPSFSQPHHYIAANTGMQINLFEALIAQDAFPRILVVSTGGVYAAQADVLTENSQLSSSNPYVISKRAQEMLATYYSSRGFDIIIARPFNHIGPGQRKGFIVSDIASQVVEAERAGGGEIRAGDLRPKRDYTDVRDVARAYYAIILRGKSGTVYNVCSGQSYSGQEIVNQLIQLAKAPISVSADPMKIRPSEVMNVSASHRRLSDDTGWQPRIPLEQTLAEVMNDWRRRLANESA